MPRGGSKKKIRDSPASELSDDLLVEIISRVPYKSTRCCKCVCTRWLDLVSHPDHRRKLPRPPLAGFFYTNKNHTGEESRRYISLSGPPIDPSISFLPAAMYNGVTLLDCCNGLLLCRQRWATRPDYMVCNPVTQTWTAVPAIEWPDDDDDDEAPLSRLSFDPIVSSSHFHVFELVHASAWEADTGRYIRRITSVRIYSSEAGVWTRPRSASWHKKPIVLRNNSRTAILDGVLYFPTPLVSVMAVVDREGNCSVLTYPTPSWNIVSDTDVYVSQGQLHLAIYDHSQLSIWALEDPSSTNNWILKHNVSHLQLLEKQYSSFTPYFTIIGDPEHNDVVFVVCRKVFHSLSSVMKLLSYKLDSRDLHFVCELPSGCSPPYHPYVPLFSEYLADRG